MRHLPKSAIWIWKRLINQKLKMRKSAEFTADFFTFGPELFIIILGFMKGSKNNEGLQCTEPTL